MKVSWLLPSLRVNGATVIFELADGLSAKGHNVRITSLDKLEPPLYPLQVQPQKLEDSLEYFKEADVIIAYYPACAFYINDLDVRAKKFYFLIDNIKKLYPKAVFKANFPKLDDDRLQIEYDTQQTYIEASYQLPFNFLTTNGFLLGKKTKIIPIGVNHKLFYPDLSIPKGDRIRLLVEGNLLPWKGIQAINRALADLRGFELWTISNTKFTIKSDKHWINPTPDGLRKILSSCDILIKASYEDGAAELQAQAMACGCAVLTRETTGTAMFCKNKKNSLVFTTQTEKGSAKAIKEKLENLIKDKELREQIVRGGLETVKELTWEKSVSKLESVLRGGKNG